MNERTRKAKTRKAPTAPDAEVTHIDPAEPVPLRPGQPDDNDGSNSPGPDAGQGLLPPAPLNGVSPILGPDITGGAQPSQEQLSQADAAVKLLRDQLGIPAIERSIMNIAQELQIRNGLALSSTGTPGTGRSGLIERLLGVVEQGISKLPPMGSSGNTDLTNRLVDMAIRGIDQNNQIAETVKLGIAKQLGVDLGTQTTKHMTVAHP